MRSIFNRLSPEPSTVLLLIVTLLAGFALAYNNIYPLTHGIHETRVLETAREMTVTGDWLIPHYDGGIRLQKPPLPYWATAIMFKVTGDAYPWAARTVLVLLGLGLILGTYWIALGLERRSVAVIAVALLASSYLFIIEFRKVTPDPYLASLVTLAIAALAWAYRRNGRTQNLLMFAGYLTLALAILAKGPIAIVFVALGLWFTHPHDHKTGFPYWRHLLGLTLAVVPVAIWAVLVAHQVPDGTSLWWHEVTGRLTGEAGGERPPWFYGPVILESVLPFSVFFLWSLFTNDHRPNYCRRWFISGFVFLVFLSSRKAAYLLPLLPVACIMTARFIAEQLMNNRLRAAFWLQAVINTTLAIPLVVVGLIYADHLSVINAILAILLTGTLLIIILYPGTQKLPVGTFLLNSVLITLFYFSVIKDNLPRDETVLQLGSYIRYSVNAGDDFYALNMRSPTLTFYAHRIPQHISRLEEIHWNADHTTWLLSRTNLDDKALPPYEHRVQTYSHKGESLFLYSFNNQRDIRN